jgi:hypothetical protein
MPYVTASTPSVIGIESGSAFLYDLGLRPKGITHSKGLDRLLSRGVVRLRQSDHDVRS